MPDAAVQPLPRKSARGLVGHQVSSLERGFIEDGGYSEQLAAERLARRRSGLHPSDRTDPTDRSEKKPQAPVCPLCGLPMALRTARKGLRPGSQFWGCSGYPQCKGTLPL